MAGLRFAELQSRPLEFLDFTSVTLDEFQHLVPPFEAAFHARMATWRMDGKPRTARRFTVYKNCPLPTRGNFQRRSTVCRLSSMHQDSSALLISTRRSKS